MCSYINLHIIGSELVTIQLNLIVINKEIIKDISLVMQNEYYCKTLCNALIYKASMNIYTYCTINLWFGFVFLPIVMMAKEKPPITVVGDVGGRIAIIVVRNEKARE